MTAGYVDHLRSGGAVLDDGGIPVWFESWRAAQDELDARTTPHTTVDYPTAPTPSTATTGVGA